MDRCAVLDRAGSGLMPAVSAFAWFGLFFLRVFNPQIRADRAAFARGLILWAALGVAAWLLMDPIADAEWISDKALLRIAMIYSWASGFWSFALFVLTARRCHDCGISGGWALLVGIPLVNLLVLAAGLSLPGSRDAALVWKKDFEL